MPGYRDWIVVPIPDKPGRYYKKKILQFRGDIALQKPVDVLQADGTIKKETGYFDPNDETKILSHKKP
jgi:hypothetical protein